MRAKETYYDPCTISWTQVHVLENAICITEESQVFIREGGGVGTTQELEMLPFQRCGLISEKRSSTSCVWICVGTGMQTSVHEALSAWLIPSAQIGCV